MRKILSASFLTLSVLVLSNCAHKESAPAVAAESTSAVAVVQAPGKCLAVGRSAADQACYKIKTQAECLSESDKLSCGWEPTGK